MQVDIYEMCRKILWGRGVSGRVIMHLIHDLWVILKFGTQGDQRYFRYLGYFLGTSGTFWYLKFIWYLMDVESTCMSDAMSV